MKVKYSLSRMVTVLKRIFYENERMAHFCVSKVDSLADELVDMKLKEAPSSHDITLHSSTTLSPDYRFSAVGYHTSDKDGIVDLSTNPSTGGTYKNINPMGLIWSLVPDEGQRRGLRFLPNIFNPVTLKVCAYLGHISKFDNVQPIAEVVVRRHWITDDIEYQHVKHGRLRGVLFSPKKIKEKAPAILDLYGSGGGIMPHRAALLAQKGFVAFSLAFFRYEDLPSTMYQIDLQYFIEAVDYLRQLETVKRGGIGAIGLSKGADILIDVAALSPHIKALALVNGSAFSMAMEVRWEGGVRKPLPLDLSKVTENEKGDIIFRDAHYIDDFDDSQTLPIERVSGKILIFACEEDTNVSAVKSANILSDKLNRHGRGNDCRVVTYKGAGHLLEPAYMPHCDSMYMPHFGGYVASMGGVSQMHHEAQLRYWPLLIDFFKTNLSEKKNGLPHRL